MLRNCKSASFTFALLLFAAASAQAQTNAPTSAATPTRVPSVAARPFVVLTAQSLAEVEKRVQAAGNKVEEIAGGAGMQTRVAVQHEANKADAQAEVHDAADDYYYVLDGTATLTLGGRLERPREVSPGEWRGASIVGGKEIKIEKGALVFVPRGTPHRRSTAGQDFSMILIKVFAEPTRAVAGGTTKNSETVK